MLKTSTFVLRSRSSSFVHLKLYVHIIPVLKMYIERLTLTVRIHISMSGGNNINLWRNNICT